MLVVGGSLFYEVYESAVYYVDLLPVKVNIHGRHSGAVPMTQRSAYGLYRYVELVDH